MKYLIYKHTIKNTNKSYIGFTSQTMEKRLHKHFLNANSGIKTKFYNALNKYGIQSVYSEILEYAETENEALNIEEFYINKFNTYKNGYNSTIRGGGGWIIGQLSEEKQKEYFQKISLATTGKNNPNYSGFTDAEITLGGVDFYIKNNNTFNIRKWYKYCDEHGYPKTFSKCRFDNKGCSGFKESICKYLGIDKLNSQIRTEEHKKKLSENQKQMCWLTNGIYNIRVYKNNVEKYDSTWKKGRTLRKNK
jgi:hypothetical protein